MPKLKQAYLQVPRVLQVQHDAVVRPQVQLGQHPPRLQANPRDLLQGQPGQGRGFQNDVANRRRRLLQRKSREAGVRDLERGHPQTPGDEQLLQPGAERQDLLGRVRAAHHPVERQRLEPAERGRVHTGGVRDLRVAQHERLEHGAGGEAVEASGPLLGVRRPVPQVRDVEVLEMVGDVVQPLKERPVADAPGAVPVGHGVAVLVQRDLQKGPSRRWSD